jgi:hypothetical protein
VQFKLDGADLSAEDTATPYSVSWNTATASNGTHTLTAVARDAAGNVTTSTSVTVTVSNAVNPNLVGAWAFEEGSGTSTADASGHTLTGTLTNATWTTSGKFGKALSFNGTNALVTVAHNSLLALTTGMTIEAWVRPAATSTDWATAIIKERGTTGLAYGLYAADGANQPPAGYINRSGTDVSTTGTSVLAVNTWSHLAVTYDGANLRLYVNGTQAASKAQTGNINSSTAPLRFGGNTIWGEYFNGLIDEVRVYNVALTATQIQTDMNTAIGSPQVATEGAVPGGSVSVLTAADLAPVAAEAARRWEAIGLTPAQSALLAGVQYRIVDLGAAPILGLTPVGGTVVELDDDGAGRGWFVDPTPGEDVEFGRGGAAGYDLLTVAMHELGHVLGLDDLDPAAAPDDLMAATLPTGARRLPGPAAEATPIASPVAGPVGVPAVTAEAPAAAVDLSIAFGAPELTGAPWGLPTSPASEPTVRDTESAADPTATTGDRLPSDPATDGGQLPVARLESAPHTDALLGDEPWGVWVGDDPVRR